LAGFAAVAAFFYWIRFYVPFVMLASSCVWMLSQWQDNRKYLVVPAALAGCQFVLPLLYQWQYMLDFSTAYSGMLRFALTPRPWGIEECYSFLLVPSLLHWIFCVPGLIGAWMLWQKSPVARLYLIHVAFVFLSYSVTKELLGPRQRLQVSFIIAWAQFHFLWELRPQEHFQTLRQPRIQRTTKLQAAKRLSNRRPSSRAASGVIGQALN
jgi:hypothetical protein